MRAQEPHATGPEHAAGESFLIHKLHRSVLGFPPPRYDAERGKTAPLCNHHPLDLTGNSYLQRLRAFHKHELMTKHPGRLLAVHNSSDITANTGNNF